MMCVDLKRHFNWLKVAVMAVLAVMVMRVQIIRPM